ncbi:hypothetical protein GE09DRAFT_1078954 [Coniochaeta sp. 2T2.1]|nr:hypothetical protein GE09DRAFT_1078954 [Coniochaeta sp. 2T2.1]
MRFFQRSRAKTGQSHSGPRIQPLRPTMHFLQVLVHCSWHLIETARYEQSLEILQVCLDAWNDFDARDAYPTIYTHICNHMGVANHWSGNFDQSAKFYGEVYKIHHDIFPDGHFERGNILCNLGNLHLSLGKPEAALKYHLEAQTSFKIGQPAEAEFTDQAIISTGRAKCYLDLGRLQEARETANYSIDALTKLGYTLSRAHSIRLLGDIEFAEGHLPAAKKCYEQSKNLLLKEMGTRTHQMLGAAYIRLGCLAQETGDYTKAICWFRDALKLADFNTFCKGYRARSLYMLSQALQAVPDPSPTIRSEAEATVHEAKTLLRQILGDKFREEMCNDGATFDNLVVVHVR